jgi:hypothetical protein
VDLGRLSVRRRASRAVFEYPYPAASDRAARLLTKFRRLLRTNFGPFAKPKPGKSGGSINRFNFSHISGRSVAIDPRRSDLGHKPSSRLLYQAPLGPAGTEGIELRLRRWCGCNQKPTTRKKDIADLDDQRRIGLKKALRFNHKTVHGGGRSRSGQPSKGRLEVDYGKQRQARDDHLAGTNLRITA